MQYDLPQKHQKINPDSPRAGSDVGTAGRPKASLNSRNTRPAARQSRVDPPPLLWRRPTHMTRGATPGVHVCQTTPAARNRTLGVLDASVRFRTWCCERGQELAISCRALPLG